MSSIAETAQLAVDLKLNTIGSFKGATSEIAGVEAAAARSTAGTGLLSRGFGAASGAASRFGGALSHARSQIGGLLSGPLGLIGLGAGLFTITGALEGGIQKATEMGKAASRLSAMTGLAVETTSALSAAFDHFGIGVDQQIRLVGFLEKNIGLLAARKDGIANFEKTFSFSLTDANGKLKDANALILQSADYFNNKSIPATTKAAALAKLYGRSWQDLIPILSAGRAGIQGAEEEAAKFGLTLTKDNIGALTRLREATRNWGTALGGLEVQIGLLVVGPLTDLANFGTQFIAKNRQGIQQFFQNLIKTAQGFAAFVTGTVVPTLVSIGTAAKTAWNAIPAPLRDLLVKGFIADKAIKFLFGFSPITFAKDAIGGLVKGFFQRGGSPATPLFVTQVGGIGGGPGGGGLGLLGAAGLGAIIVAAAVPIGQAFAAALPDWMKGGPGPDTGKTQSQLAYEASHREQQGGTLRSGGLDSAAVRGIGSGIADRMLDSPLGKISSATITQGIKSGLVNEFRAMEAALKTARKPEDVKKAVEEAMRIVVTQQRGDVGNTKQVLSELKAQLRNTHDPQLQSVLKTAIDKVEAKVQGREWAQKQLDKANAILRSSEAEKQKLADLTAIQKTLRDRGDIHAANIIKAKIEEAKRADVLAAHTTAKAIRDKQMSVSITTKVLVSARETFKQQTSYKKFAL